MPLVRSNSGNRWRRPARQRGQRDANPCGRIQGHDAKVHDDSDRLPENADMKAVQRIVLTAVRPESVGNRGTKPG
jgi:hypothetical protein